MNHKNKPSLNNLVSMLHGMWILGGDWNTLSIQVGAQELLHPEASDQFVVGPDHTHWPMDANKLPATLDFFVLLQFNNHFCNIKTCHEVSDNHSTPAD